MEQQTQQLLYCELEQIDEALHRLKERLLSQVKKKSDRENILMRTGGVLNKQHAKKDIMAWQRKVRDEWGS